MSKFTRDGFEVITVERVIKYRITSWTSGTELRGPPIFEGDHPTQRDADQALADDARQFTRRQPGGDYWMALGGYTTATVDRIVLDYDPDKY